MRAVLIDSFGGTEQLRLTDIPQPVPDRDEVLIRIAAAGVNPIDWLLREGRLAHRIPLQLPAVLGYDFSGVVADAGADAKIFVPGDEVYGYTGVQRWGCYAEFAVASQSAIAHRPVCLDAVSAAAIPLAALTAWQALIETAGLGSGQRVLIHAAAGGVGTTAVQIAKAAGAFVYGTASATNAALIRALGCDVAIDYQRSRFEDIARDVDVVLDTLGGQTQRRSWGCLLPGGMLVSLVSKPAMDHLAARGRQGELVAARPDGARLTQFAALIESGELRPVIDCVLPLDAVATAHERSRSGHACGKIILAIAPSAARHARAVSCDAGH